MKKCISIALMLCLLLSLFAGMMPIAAEGLRSVTGKENETIIYKYIVGEMGFNNAAAAGILANIYRESSFNPNCEGDNGTSYGICQWHASRWEDLKIFCNSMGYDWKTLEGQLHFLEFELERDYKSLIDNLKSLHNTDFGAYRAGYYWCYQFERPAGYKDGNSERRAVFARDTFWPVYRGNDYEHTTEWSSSYPQGIDESLIETWDEYRRMDYKTSKTTDPDHEDWDLLGEGWEETGNGSVSYVEEFPEGFDKENNYYVKYHQSPVPEESTASKKTTASYETDGWLYYHWCEENGEDGTVSAEKTEACGVFHAFFTTTSPASLSRSPGGDGSYEIDSPETCGGSRYYFACEVKKQTYVILEYLYTFGYWGDWGSWLEWTPLVEKAIKKLDPATYKLERRTQYRYIVIPDYPVEMVRYAGQNRMQTAVEISKVSYASAENVVLASGDAFPDALAGGVLAYALKAPILLVRGKLDADTKAEIERLGAKKVFILGGEVAIAKAVENELQKTVDTERIAGQNRYETAVKIAEKTAEINGETPRSVFFASSSNDSFADAISVSAPASILGSPILYISPSGRLDEKTDRFLAEYNIEIATVVGGYNAVSQDAEENLKAMGLRTEERLKGQSRYDTCLDVLSRYEDLLKGDVITAATGLDYPDALTGGVYAAIHKAPLMLVGRSLSKEQIAYLKAHRKEKLVIFGGEAFAVSKAVADDLLNALKH